MAQDSQDILVDTPLEGVRRITFNRPQTLNAFTSSMWGELLGILGRIKTDPGARVVVITGAGRGFCAGADLSRPVPADWISPDVGPAYRTLYTMQRYNQIPPMLRSMPQPVIAAINGAVAGVGYPMALACDIAVAASSAKFVNAIHNAGSGAELGLSYLLPRAVGAQRAAELLLTARPVLADEAERIGLVLKTVPDDKLMDSVLEIASNIMVNSPIGIWLTKQSMWQNAHAGSLEQAIELETRATIVSNTTADTQEKRAAFREKRKPKFEMK